MVINVLINHAHKLSRELYRLLTSDRSKEIADRRCFILATDIQCGYWLGVNSVSV